MKGTTTVLIVLDVKPDHIEHTEKEKEKITEDKDSKASPVENSSSDKTEDRQTGDTADKHKKSDLVLNIPEKMVVSLEESLDELDSTEGNIVIDEMAKDDIDIRDVEETIEPSQTLNMSFGTSLKQNLLVVHDIKTENLYDGYDKLSEGYAGEESKAGPEKATAAKASPVKSRAASAGDSAKTGPIKTKVSSGDASKTAPAKPPDVDKTDSSLVVDVIVKDKEAKKEATNTVNVTVHLDEDLAIKHKEKGINIHE